MEKEKVKQIRKEYPEGTRILLEHMDDPYRPVPKGTVGTVRFVDDTGTIHMAWDNGQGLGLIIGEDQFTALEKAEPIKVLVVRPDQKPQIETIYNTLKDMQKIVEGNLEEVHIDKDAVLVCNEEGKLLNMKANRRVGQDIIAGTFFIAGDNGSEFLCSLTDEQIEKYSNQFQEIEDIKQEEMTSITSFRMKIF